MNNIKVRIKVYALFSSIILTILVNYDILKLRVAVQ